MSKPLALCMHGFGYIGRIHMMALQSCRMLPHLNPNIHWKRCFVRDVNSEAYRLASQVFEEVVVDDGGPLDLSGVDAIDIASPNDLHARVALEAVQARVHLYCEKPLAASLEESKVMLDAVSSSGLVHQVALCNRVLPQVEKTYALIHSGVLGKVLTFRATKLHGGYLDTKRPMSWRLQRSKSGAGALMDLGVHAIDLLLFLLGPVEDVDSTLRTFVPERTDASGNRHTVDVDDWAHLQLTMASGAVGTLEVSRVHYGQEESTLTIVCERGTIALDLGESAGPHVSLLQNAATPDVHSTLAPYWLPPKYSTDGFIISHAASLLTFLDRVRGKQIDYPLPTFRDAWLAESLVHETLRVAKFGNSERI